MHRTVWLTGLVSFCTDISTQMIQPLLPLFLANALKTPVAAIGVIEGAGDATASLLRAYAGRASDRLGRRKELMLLGYGVSNLVRPLFAFSTSWLHVLLIRFADRVGKGLRAAPRDALIADVTPEDQRGRAYGLHQAFDRLGEALGPLAASALLVLYHNDYRATFLWSIAPAALAMVFLSLVREEPRPGGDGGSESNSPPQANSAPSLVQKALTGGVRWNAPLVRLLLASGLFALGNSADAFLVLRAQEAGIAERWIPIAYFVYKMTASLLAVPAGVLSDKIGRRRVLLVGYLVFALIYAGFALASAAWQIWPLFAVYGVYLAATKGVERAFVADLAPAGSRGAALGRYNSIAGLMALPASIVTGLLWDIAGSAPALLTSAALAFVAAIALTGVRPAGPAPGETGLKA